MTTISECEAYEARIDWRELVDLALGGAGVDPAPELLHASLQAWLRLFEAAYGGDPKLVDFPRPVIGFFETLGKVKKKPGRPRCDQQRLLKARNAWEACVYKTSYQMRKSTIKIFGRQGGTQKCFGFDKKTMKSETPSALAIAKTADEMGLSDDCMRTLLHPSKRK